MSYTLSCDASVKVGKEAVRGLLHHTAREVDRLNGCEVKHRNKDIDPDKTPLNETYVRAAAGDGWTRCTDIRQAQDALKGRLKDVRKTIRHDAVVLRELLLEMDPKWMEDHPDEDEREKSLEDMLDWCKDHFGADNLVFYSVHKDERNWHIHAGICPVSADGRLAQKDWFGSPTKLAAMHAGFREHMQGRGYDIQKKEKKAGDPSRHLTDAEYKAFKDALRAEKEAVLAQAKVEADSIRADAQAEAEDIRADARKTAQKEASDIRWRAEQEAGNAADKVWQQTMGSLDMERASIERRRKEVEAEAEAIRNRAQEAAERARSKAEAEASVIIATARQEAQEAAMSAKVDMDVAASILANCQSLAAEMTEERRQRMAALDAQRQRIAAQAEAVMQNQGQGPDEPSPS